MGKTHDLDFSMYWSGLAILDRLSETGTGLTSEEVGALLGTRSVKGIGSALSGTKTSLAQVGIRLDEAVSRRSVRGRTVWTRGPRIRQARHALEHARRWWTGCGRQDGAPIEDVEAGYPGPVLVLRALRSRGTTYRIDGGMAELDDILDDEYFEVEGGVLGGWIGEIFIARIEPGNHVREQPAPEGYGENGIWVRGMYDYADPRVAGAIGTGRDPTLFAWIGEAAWVERRIALVDAVRQVERVRAGRSPVGGDPDSRWRAVDEEDRFRYVNWIGADGPSGRRSAPPLRMRLRCWYEIVIETAGRKRVVLREEGLRGDDRRTAARAIERWRRTHAKNANELVVVREVRIAKRQPRPLPPDESGPRPVNDG